MLDISFIILKSSYVAVAKISDSVSVSRTTLFIIYMNMKYVVG